MPCGGVSSELITSRGTSIEDLNVCEKYIPWRHGGTRHGEMRIPPLRTQVATVSTTTTITALRAALLALDSGRRVARDFIRTDETALHLNKKRGVYGAGGCLFAFLGLPWTPGLRGLVPGC